ncbi:hypothetical protein GCM10009735_73660 [Actinomadura chokoriensis]
MTTAGRAELRAWGAGGDFDAGVCIAVPDGAATRCPGAFRPHVAAELGVSPPTVAKWHRRFIEHGPADEPRWSSALEPLDKVQEVVTLTLEQNPPGATH